MKDFDKDIAGFDKNKRQMYALSVLDSGKIKFLLFGGAMGGGKSFFLRWFGIRFLLRLAMRGMYNVPIMLACEDYPALKDRQLQKIHTEFPAWLGEYVADHKVYGRSFILKDAYGSGVICFRNLDDPSKYASAEFACILVDELTKNDYITFSFLRTRLRWAGLKDIECFFCGGTNPGGIGHGWVKQLWIDREFPPEFINPIDYRAQFAYIPSKADDNPLLDETYWQTLNTLPLHMRKAFRDGDWDTFVNQAFIEWSKHQHIIKPIPIPEDAPIYMSFDWGFGKPFSIGWWWFDIIEDILYRFAEYYGWNGTPDAGTRLPDTEIAKGIIKKEMELGLFGRKIIRLAGHDCFSKKPDYKGGGQGKSTAEVFRDYGLHLKAGDPSRHLKLRQFHERLKIREDGKAGMLIYDTCVQFTRTIPSLVVDKKDIEDIDTKTEDHVYDEACHVVMARAKGVLESLNLEGIGVV